MPLPLTSPLPPQLARSRSTLPEGDGWAYEPKWDGFRAVAFVDGDDVELQSRNGRSLTRYFPELRFAPGRYVLDGEIIIELESGHQEFDLLSQRIHPAASRVKMLSEKTPATYVAFDLLARDDEALLDRRPRPRVGEAAARARRRGDVRPRLRRAHPARRQGPALARGQGPGGVPGRAARHVTGAGLPSVEQAVALYAAGWFPMDDAGSGELPWYAADQRAVFELDRAARERLARKVRRSLRACDGFVLRVDSAYDRVLDLCATPPPGERAWISERLKVLYRRLHAAGFSHTFELWTPGGELAAGILGVVLGRAALLESMRRVRPHAGNALLSRTVDRLAQMGATLCDVQIATDHTLRLGARELPREEFDARLQAALGGWPPDCEHGAR